MTIRGQHEKRHLYFHAVLVFAVIFTAALTAAGLSGDQTGKHTFELRLASHEKVEGWERVPGPGPGETPIWISPEAKRRRPRGSLKRACGRDQSC